MAGLFIMFSSRRLGTGAVPSHSSVAPRTHRTRARRLFVVGLLGVVAAACSTGSGPAAQAQSSAPQAKPIAVRALKFEPSKLTVKVGTKVNWLWREKVAHNIIFKDKKYSSKVQNKGSFSTTFEKPGTFKYQCTLHPGMKGEIVVTK
jgi:plastocyanin